MRSVEWKNAGGRQTAAGRAGAGAGFRWLVTAAFLMLYLVCRPFQALALDAGAYLVTVTPSYKDPETGKIEDLGNNEAIGQGMTERLCGSTGLLEVDGSGEMWLTVRYYLSQFVSDVSFEERSGGSYLTRSHTAMQTRKPVEGATDIQEKYGFTDYRFKIESYDSVIRGKAYIEPMGRNVVYFLTASSPSAGSGDFVVTAGTSQTAGVGQTGSGTSQPAAGASQAGTGSGTSQPAAGTSQAGTGSGTSQQTAGASQAGTGSGTGQPAAGQTSGSETSRPEADAADQGAADDRYRYYPDDELFEEEPEQILGDGINGSGNADDPVTGIPQKPFGTVGQAAAGSNTANGQQSSAGSGTANGQQSSAGQTAATGSQGAGDLSGSSTAGQSGDTQWSAAAAKPASAEAKQYGESLLKDAVGITMTVGSVTAVYEEAEQEEKETNGYKTVMYVLLGLSCVLMISFIVSGLKKHTNGSPKPSEDGAGESRPAASDGEPESGQPEARSPEPSLTQPAGAGQNPASSQPNWPGSGSSSNASEPAKALSELDEIERRQGGLR